MRARLAVALALIAACHPRAPGVASMKRGIVAHRGASLQAPENTLAALKLGWAAGAESCEIDVRVTRDGGVILMHDDTAARTTGVDRPIAEMTLEEISVLDAGGWKAARWSGEPVPTLGDAIAAIPPGRMLFIEIKTSAADAAVIARAITDAQPARGAIALQGYDADALAAVSALLPGVPTYWDVDPPYSQATFDAAVERGFTGLALDHRGMQDAMLPAIREAGLSLDVWTVNDPAQIRAWLGRGARYVETDNP
jgi:glycerophosphoryl diester phosphodiesterase